MKNILVRALLLLALLIPINTTCFADEEDDALEVNADELPRDVTALLPETPFWQTVGKYKQYSLTPDSSMPGTYHVIGHSDDQSFIIASGVSLEKKDVSTARNKAEARVQEIASAKLQKQTSERTEFLESLASSTQETSANQVTLHNEQIQAAELTAIANAAESPDLADVGTTSDAVNVVTHATKTAEEAVINLQTAQGELLKLTGEQTTAEHAQATAEYDVAAATDGLNEITHNVSELTTKKQMATADQDKAAEKYSDLDRDLNAQIILVEQANGSVEQAKKDLIQPEQTVERTYNAKIKAEQESEKADTVFAEAQKLYDTKSVVPFGAIADLAQKAQSADKIILARLKAQLPAAIVEAREAEAYNSPAARKYRGQVTPEQTAPLELRANTANAALATLRTEIETAQQKFDASDQAFKDAVSKHMEAVKAIRPYERQYYTSEEAKNAADAALDSRNKEYSDAVDKTASLKLRLSELAAHYDQSEANLRKTRSNAKNAQADLDVANALAKAVQKKLTIAEATKKGLTEQSHDFTQQKTLASDHLTDLTNQLSQALANTKALAAKKGKADALLAKAKKMAARVKASKERNAAKAQAVAGQAAVKSFSAKQQAVRKQPSTVKPAETRTQARVEARIEAKAQTRTEAKSEIKTEVNIAPLAKSKIVAPSAPGVRSRAAITTVDSANQMLMD